MQQLVTKEHDISRKRTLCRNQFADAVGDFGVFKIKGGKIATNKLFAESLERAVAGGIRGEIQGGGLHRISSKVNGWFPQKC